MKLLAALLFGFTSLVYAQNTGDQRSISFNFSQANLALNLDQKDFETIYRTDQVPDTCYRDEVQGTRTECHTEYDHQCNTRYEQECYNQSFPVCQNIPRRVCSTEQRCTTTNDRVCRGNPPNQTCTNVPRRVCNPVQECRTQNDQVCHNEYRTVCQNVPRQYCQNVPRQACIQVPNVVKVPYACTRPVQVPIGQQLKLHTVAQVAINLVNFAEVGQTPDQLVAQLVNGNVNISALNQNTNAFLYQIVGQQRNERMISATEKVITYSFSVMATSIQKLNAFLNSQIVDSKLFYDHLDFNILGSLNVPLKGHLKVLQYRGGLRSNLIMIDDDFASSAIVGRGNVQSIMFNNFGVSSLNSAKHLIELSLKLDFALLQKGLINAAALTQVADKAVLNSFEAYPAQ